MAEIPSTNDAFNQALPAGQGLDQAFDSATTPVAAPAENTPAISAQPAEHGPVNVLNPQGELVSIPGEQLQDALANGYSQATDAHVDAYVKHQKYGSGVEQLKTGLEGAAESATFGLSTGVEQAFGVKPEDIQGRREENPISHAVGQVAGLAGSALIPGVGEANLLKGAGEVAATAVGLGEASVLAKIGSGAVKAAVENALFQSGDEVSKMLAKDPNQSAQTAMVDIGLAGLIGGGIGGTLATVNPLWQATAGPKVEGLLNAVKNHLGGIQGEAASDVATKAANLGLEVPKVLKAKLAGNELAENAFSTLNQSDNASGQVVQKANKAFREDISTKAMESLGKTKEEVLNYSPAKQGREAMETFKQEYRDISAPISKEYSKITERFDTAKLSDVAYPAEGKNQYASRQSAQDSIIQQVAQMAEDKGYSAPSAPQSKVVQSAIEQLNKAETIQDLSRINTLLRESTFSDPALHNVGKELKNIILENQQELLGNAINKDAPELFNRYQMVRKGYADLARLSDEAGQNLSIGKFHGSASFLDALEQKRTPEEFLSKLSPGKNAELIPFLQKNFPQTLEKIKDNELFKVLKPSVMRTNSATDVNMKSLVSALKGMSPEMRSFAVGDEALSKIQDAHSLLEKLDDPTHNFSNTARTVDKLMGGIPGTAVGAVALLAHANPVLAGLLGAMTHYLGKDAPDALRLSMLKFLASEQPVEASGFKAAVDYIQHTIKGEKLVGSATKNLFNSAKVVIPDSMIPTQRDKDSLEKKLRALKTNPEKLLDVGGKTSSYMPEHGQALAQTSSAAVRYLNNLRPKNDPSNPLDTPREPSMPEKAAYNRALEIAQQPLVVLDSIKKGNLTPQDVQSLSVMYPDLYSKLKDKVTAEMTSTLQKGNTIPYKMRVGLGAFLGQPLDSTMTPMGIASAQLTASGKSPQQPQDQQPTKHSMTALNKLPGAYQTPDQARAAKALKD